MYRLVRVWVPCSWIWYCLFSYFKRFGVLWHADGVNSGQFGHFWCLNGKTEPTFPQFAIDVEYNFMDNCILYSIFQKFGVSTIFHELRFFIFTETFLEAIRRSCFLQKCKTLSFAVSCFKQMNSVVMSHWSFYSGLERMATIKTIRKAVLLILSSISDNVNQ